MTIVWPKITSGTGSSCSVHTVSQLRLEHNGLIDSTQVTEKDGLPTKAQWMPTWKSVNRLLGVGCAFGWSSAW